MYQVVLKIGWVVSVEKCGGCMLHSCGSEADDSDGDEVLEDDARLPENCTSHGPSQGGRVRNIFWNPNEPGTPAPGFE